MQEYEIIFKEYIKLLKEKNLDSEIIKEAVRKTNLQLRDGTKEFLKKMNEMNIPVIIISCGLENIIKEYLKFNSCDYDNISIYANYCNIDGKGKNDIYQITPYNKNQITFLDNLKIKVETKKYILLLGDKVDDVNMVTKEKLENTVTVGFLDKKIEQNLELYKTTFDIVLTHDASFEELQEILVL